jgi:DNA-binding transcriptional LysR family regulator
MQDYDWNDLKYALALYRSGTLAGAGRILGVNETTVARRLKALEHTLQARLFLPNGAARYEVTEVGAAVIDKAVQIEQDNAALSEVVGRFENRLFGVVRITSVPVVVNRILVPHLSVFRAAHPGVTIELVPDSRNLSLSKREADLALRLARPETGGLRTKARKVGQIVFAVYCPAYISDDNVDGLDWIGYDDAHSDLPQARWLAAASRAMELNFPCLRVCDLETAHEAVAAGLGRSLLPRIVADRDPRLRRVSGEKADLPVRDIWLLSHLDQDTARTVQAAKEWLTAIGWSGDR